jgi:hypothetical protein
VRRIETLPWGVYRRHLRQAATLCEVGRELRLRPVLKHDTRPQLVWRCFSTSSAKRTRIADSNSESLRVGIPRTRQLVTHSLVTEQFHSKIGS